MTQDLLQDLAYYRSRAAQEERAVRDSVAAVARERHQELADAYHFRCRALAALSSERHDVSTRPFVRLPETVGQPMLAA